MSSYLHLNIMAVILALSTTEVVFLQALIWSMHRAEAVLTQLTGFNPPLFISKYTAVNNNMRLKPYRPNTHDQCSNRVHEYHSFFKPSIIKAQISPLCSPKKLQILRRRRNICHAIHCNYNTMAIVDCRFGYQIILKDDYQRTIIG